MSVLKLGEALIKEGLITRQQLEQSLQRQVQFGGRIGTNLVEIKAIAEGELSSFLGRYFRAPAVQPEMIQSIPEDVVSAISTEIVEKYKVLPFKRERNRLHTAMLDPKDIKTIDELRFITGYDIIPYVITEMRLLFALEKYYDLKRELRYIGLADHLTISTEVEKTSIDKIKESFTAIKDTEEIAGILIQAAGKIASRVAVFIVKGKKISGWKARGLTLGSFEAGEEEFSVFQDVMQRKNYYRGPILNVKGNEPLITLLSGTPQDALLMPIQIRDRIAAFLYADNGNTAVLNADINFLLRISNMAAIAFEIMILKKKILDS